MGTRVLARLVFSDIAYICFLICGITAVISFATVLFEIEHGSGLGALATLLLVPLVFVVYVALPLGCVLAVLIWRRRTLLVLVAITAATAFVMATEPVSNTEAGVIGIAYGATCVILGVWWFAKARGDLARSTGPSN